MVSIVTVTMRQHFMENVFENYNRQNCEKELIVVLNKNTMDLEEWKNRAREYQNVRVYQLDEKATLGKCLNFGAAQASFGVIAKFDDDDYYGSEYLTQAIKAMDLTGAAVVGKSSFYLYFVKSKVLFLAKGVQNSYTNWLAGPTLVFRKSVFDFVSFRNLTVAEDYHFVQDCLQAGLQVYASDCYNFVLLRRDNQEHTWLISEGEEEQIGRLIAYTEDYLRYILPE